MDPTVIAAVILAIPALVGAYASLRTRNDVKTNHGKKIGTHVEDLVDFADNMQAWAVLHQDSDNQLREALGLGRIDLPFPKTH